MPHGDLPRERPRVLARSGRWRVVGHLGHVRNPSTCGTTEPGHWCRAGDRRRRGRSRVQTQVAPPRKKGKKKKKKSTPATKTTTTTGDAERPCRNLLLFSNIPPLVDTLFPRGGTETQWYASPSSRLLHVPHPPTQGVHGVFLPPCLIQEAKLNMLPCHRRALSFRAAAASLRQRHARTTCTNTRALLELCLRKNRELVWCLVCVEWPPNLFDAPDQQCIV